MVKKRFWLAILLLVSLLVNSYDAEAGCCQGIIGCSRAFFESSCSSLSTFDVNECENIVACDVVACCHTLPDMPKATYRGICQALEPAAERTIHIKSFDTNPSSEMAYAELLCEGAALPACQYVSCEAANQDDCQCGSATSGAESSFCCSRDNSAFPNFGACSASPSCKVSDFYSIYGQILNPDGIGIAGAEVRAGGKEVISEGNGNYTIPLLPDQSSGTVVAIKNSTINSTSYFISGADVLGLDIILAISALPPEGVEICDNGWDDNGNQFFWNSTLEGFGDAADRCDVDCNLDFLPRPALKKTVTKLYYIPKNPGEYYVDASGVHDSCSDGFDNDCDGLQDCEDDQCFGISPACLNTSCGNGIIEFPNSNGIYEQCDYYDRTGAPIVNATGGPIGNDTLCPDQCLPPGDPKECTCQYELICGNGVIDEPLEDCDGSFIAAVDEWDPALYNVGSECTIDVCGKPTDIRPCQCPPPQVCGNGIREAPEECDPGGGGEDPDDGPCLGQCSPDCSCPPAGVVCGNNLLEPEEDCDGTLTLAGYGWEEFKFRKFGCSPSTCSLPKLVEDPGNTPYYDPVGVNHESDYAAYEVAYDDYLLNTIGVEGPCECPTNCKVDPFGPLVVEVKPEHWKRNITVEWTDDCMFENARAYNVYRCEALGPGGVGCEPTIGVYTVLNQVPLGITNVYPDSDFEGSTVDEEKYYCYIVEGLYGDMVTDQGTKDSAGSWDPEVNCIKAGQEDCFSFKETYPFANEFCAGFDYNIRSTCDENNTVVMVDDPDDLVDCNNPEGGFADTEYVCVGPYAEDDPTLAGKTKCVPKSVCDYCNDPLGLFGFSGTEEGMPWYGTEDDFPLPEDFGQAPPTDFEQGDRFSYISCLDLTICYMDYSYTTADKFYAYESNPSCYDFHSEHACIEYNDTIGGGLCDWVWHPEYRFTGFSAVILARTLYTNRV